MPLSAIKKLNIEPSGEKVKLIGFDESENIADVYTLQIVFLGKRLAGDYCAIDAEVGILGRDVLNEFSIIFDGKSLDWRERVICADVFAGRYSPDVRERCEIFGAVR